MDDKPSAHQVVSELTSEKKGVFLAALCEGSTVVGAAKSIGLSMQTMYRHRNQEPDFHAAWEEALLVGNESIEAEIQRRAIEGWEETQRLVVSDGQGAGSHVEEFPNKKYSDTLLIFLAKGRMPDKYRERVEHTGPKGGPLLVKELTDEQLAALITAQRNAAPPANAPGDGGGAASQTASA